MVFNSIAFALFLPLVFLLYWFVFKPRAWVVLYPDSSILLNKQHWADAEHLNTSGSVLVSQGLVTQLSGYIK